MFLKVRKQLDFISQRPHAKIQHEESIVILYLPPGG